MPTRQVTAAVETPVGTLVPADDEAMRLTVDRRNTAAELTAKGLIDTAPAEDVPVQASIMDAQVFAGTATDTQATGDGRVSLTAFDAARDLKRATLSQSYNQASIATIAEDACQQAGVEYDLDLPRETTSAEYTDKRCDVVLQKMADLGKAVWVVDPQGTVVVTQEVGELSTDHELEYVLDHSTGTATPAYQSVRVYGSSPASAGASNRSGGQSAMHLLSSAPITATAGDGEPTYTYTDDDIRTQQQAQNVADRVLQKLQAQRKGGWTDIVGDPTIRPYDTVTMPGHLGGESYLVSGVTHRLSAGNGYTTRISCGGLIET